MMTTIKRAMLSAAALALAACGAEPSARVTSVSQTDTLFAAEPEAQWRLPGRLAEISGLALAPSGGVLAHDDERATIYEIDAENGRLVKAFALGPEDVRGDFEGIAVSPRGDIFLTTSQGALYRFRDGADGARVGYDVFDAGLEAVCEIEGLAYDSAADSLILACKQQHGSEMDGAIALYAWSPARPNRPARPWLGVSRAALAERGSPPLSPSSVEIDAESGRVLVLAARERMLVELSRGGEVLSARRLGEGHGQAEGLTVLRDGALLISDEANQIESAQLARYGRRG